MQSLLSHGMCMRNETTVFMYLHFRLINQSTRIYDVCPIFQTFNYVSVTVPGTEDKEVNVPDHEELILY